MKLIEWLMRATPADDDPAPEIASARPQLPPDDAPETTAQEMTRDSDGSIQLDDVFIAIEYRDSAGQMSRRRITMRRLVPRESGIILQALCHERRAFRSFRTDRISCFIDAYGEIIEPPTFWRDIGINLGEVASCPDISPVQRLRDTFRPALSVLVALSRCDAVMHPDEVLAIIAYVDDEAIDLGLPCDDTSLAALEALIIRMRPRQANIEGHYRAVMNLPRPRRNRFVRAIKEVIIADRKISLEEAAMAEEMEAWAKF